MKLGQPIKSQVKSHIHLYVRSILQWIQADLWKRDMWRGRDESGGYDLTTSEASRGFTGGAVTKDPPANAGDTRDTGSIPGAGNGNPLQYCCLDNSVNRGS